jgi:sugar lactone lactonase YvrE
MNAPQSQHAHELHGARDIMTKSLKALFTVAATIAVSACGGGGATATVPRASGAEAASAARVAASIVLKIPAASAASAQRRARYVSIVSRSAKFVLAASAGCTQCSPALTLEVLLAGQGSPCSTGPNGKTCTIPLSLNPGTYTGSLIVYDGFLDAQGHVTGKSLSENTSFPITIALSQPNAIGVVLDGVPASLTTTVLTPSTLVIGTKVVNGSATTIYRLIGNAATAQFTVTAKDADGNVIAGAGAPTYTANASNGFTAAANGNTMTLNAPSAFTKQTGALTVQANSSACTDPAAVCSIAVPIGFDQIIAVGDTAGGNVSVWPIGAAAPSATITTGINGPYSVAFASDGTLFVANYNTSTVTGYAPPYTGTPFTVSAHVSNPDAIAIDANNDLIVANYGGANVTIYPPPYTTTTPVTLNTGNFPAALAIDATQHLWIVSSSGALYRYPSPYVAGGFDKGIGTAPTTFNNPSGIALDSLGRLYVANSGNNDLLRFDPPYSSQAPSATIVSTVAQPMTQPANVIVGQNDVVLAGSQDGLDVFDSGGNGLGVFAVKFYKPRGEAIDQDGVIWVATGSGNGAVGLPPPYTNTNQLQLLSNNFFLNASAVAVYP